MSAEGHTHALLCCATYALCLSGILNGLGAIGASVKGGLYSLGQSLSNAQLLFTVSPPSPPFAVAEKTDSEIVALKL